MWIVCGNELARRLAVQKSKHRPSGLKGVMQSTIPPTLATVLTLWASQVVRQAYVDGLPAFTETLYGWQPGAVGILLTIWGFSTLPVNWLVGLLSSRVSHICPSQKCALL